MVFPYTLPTTTVDVSVGAFSASWTLGLFSRTNVRVAMDSFVVWLNEAGRPWSGSATFAWSWQDDGAGGARLRVTCTTAFRLRCTGTNPLGWPAAYATAALAVTATSAAPGAWAPAGGSLSLGRWLRQVSGRADGVGTGTARPDVPGAAPVRPTLTATCSTGAVASLQARLIASSTRQALIWQVHEATWRTVVIGAVERSAVGRTTWRLTFDCRGVP